jgi:hypothetical protein
MTTSASSWTSVTLNLLLTGRASRLFSPHRDQASPINMPLEFRYLHRFFSDNGDAFALLFTGLEIGREQNVSSRRNLARHPAVSPPRNCEPA